MHSGLLQIRGEAPDELRFLDRFGNPRDASIAPVLELLVRPAADPGGRPPATCSDNDLGPDDMPALFSRGWLLALD